MREVEEHRAILKRANGLLSEDPRVVGVYLAGSMALGVPDRWSDIDLHILVRDKELDVVIRDHDSLFPRVAPLLLRFPALHLGDPHQIIAFYRGSFPIHVDYQYRVVNDLIPRPKDAGVEILLDRTGAVERWRQECESAKENTDLPVDRLQYFEDRFWAWCWYTYSKTERGELWQSRDSIEYLRSNVLVPLAAASVGIPYEGNRRLETKLSESVQKALRDTIPANHSRDSYNEALSNVIKTYESLFGSVSEASSVRRVDRDFFRSSMLRLTEGELFFE